MLAISIRITFNKQHMSTFCYIKGIIRETMLIKDEVTCFKKVLDLEEKGISMNTYNRWHRDQERWPIKAALKQVAKDSDKDTKILIYCNGEDKFEFFHTILEYVYGNALKKLNRLEVLSLLRNSDNLIRKKGIDILHSALSSVEWDSDEVIKNRSMCMMLVFSSLNGNLPKSHIPSKLLLENILTLAYDTL